MRGMVIYIFDDFTTIYSTSESYEDEYRRDEYEENCESDNSRSGYDPNEYDPYDNLEEDY